MSARAVADSFLAHHAGRTIRRRQLLDGNQVAKLACVLGKSSRAGLGLSGENETPRNGTRRLLLFIPLVRDEAEGVIKLYRRDGI